MADCNSSKHSPDNRHLPIHAITRRDPTMAYFYRMGAHLVRRNHYIYDQGNKKVGQMTNPAKPALSVEQEAATKELHAKISRLPKYFSEQEVQNAVAPYLSFHRRQTLEEVIRKLRRARDRRKRFDDAISQAAAAELDYQADELEAELKKETPC